MLQQSTLQFLSDLKLNNNTDWFHANKKTYQAAKADFYALISELLAEIAKFDPKLKAWNLNIALFASIATYVSARINRPTKSTLARLWCRAAKNRGMAVTTYMYSPTIAFLVAVCIVLQAINWQKLGRKLIIMRRI